MSRSIPFLGLSHWASCTVSQQVPWWSREEECRPGPHWEGHHRLFFPSACLWTRGWWGFILFECNDIFQDGKLEKITFFRCVVSQCHMSVWRMARHQRFFDLNWKFFKTFSPQWQPKPMPQSRESVRSLFKKVTDNQPDLWPSLDHTRYLDLESCLGKSWEQK